MTKYYCQCPCHQPGTRVAAIKYAESSPEYRCASCNIFSQGYVIGDDPPSTKDDAPTVYSSVSEASRWMSLDPAFDPDDNGGSGAYAHQYLGGGTWQVDYAVRGMVGGDYVVTDTEEAAVQALVGHARRVKCVPAKITL